jgi:hypothetical protein
MSSASVSNTTICSDQITSAPALLLVSYQLHGRASSMTSFALLPLNSSRNEPFSSATLLSLKNGLTFPQWYMDRLERMIEFVMYYTKPDGTAPQIGDNDEGRLHILANYGNWIRLDHRYLLSVGAVLFNREDFKLAAGGYNEEAFWLLGEEGLNSYKDIK